MVTPDGFPLGYEALPRKHRQPHQVARCAAQDRSSIRRGHPRLGDAAPEVPALGHLAQRRSVDSRRDL
jgi:hypothetical protein